MKVVGGVLGSFTFFELLFPGIGKVLDLMHLSKSL
jgi:hypothetical protein